MGCLCKEGMEKTKEQICNILKKIFKPVVLRPNGGLRTIQGPRRTDAKRDIIRVQLQDRCEDHRDQHRTEERPRILLLEGHGRHRNPIPHLR